MKNIIIFGLVGILASCTPALKGMSTTKAFDLDQEELVLSPGVTWYASSTRSPHAFQMDFDSLSRQEMKFASIGRKYSEDYTHRFTIKQVGLPENWGFSLYKASAVQKITDTTQSGRGKEVRWSEFVEFIFEIKVPSGEEAGTHSTVIVVVSDTDQVTTIPVTIEITGENTIIALSHRIKTIPDSQNL